MTDEEVFAASAIRLGRQPRTIGELKRFRLGLARLRTKRIVRGAGFRSLRLTPGGEEQALAALGGEPEDVDRAIVVPCVHGDGA